MNPEPHSRPTSFTPLRLNPGSSARKRPLANSLFQDDDDSEDSAAVLIPVKRSFLRLEDPHTRCQRLKAEGITLAEQDRFWQAIHLWNQALEITPQDVKVLEMKAQALIQVHEWDPAIEIGRQIIQIDPLWWVGFQTLGRAFIGCGRVDQARWAFSKATFLNPSDSELRIEDLLWAQKLHKHWLAEKEVRSIDHSQHA